MPSFSSRWGLPSSRRKADNRERCRGRRPGNAATCRARLKGWIRNVAERSPIWGDIDLKAFCATTGYSREHATRELSKLRREGGLAFETKLRSKRGSKTRWGVIVAAPEKLLYDKHSLFYDWRGNRLHNYTTLAGSGAKIVPTMIFPVPERRPRGRPRTRPAVSEARKARADALESKAPLPFRSRKWPLETPLLLPHWCRLLPGKMNRKNSSKFPDAVTIH